MHATDASLGPTTPFSGMLVAAMKACRIGASIPQSCAPEGVIAALTTTLGAVATSVPAEHGNSRAGV
jgi:hypothetical protein